MSELVGREFHFDVEADLDLVWEALTTPEGLATWYVANASVDAREGGELTVDFGTGEFAMGTFEVFDAPHRLKLVYGGPEVGAEEWFLSHENGITHVRLIHSLMVEEGSTWDEIYGDITRGWRLFHATLMWAARTRGRLGRRREVRLGALTDGAWTRILDTLGLLETPPPGAMIELSETLTANVEISVDDYSLLLTVDGRATLVVDVEGDSLYTLTATYDDESDSVAELRAAIVAVAQRLCDAAAH